MTLPEQSDRAVAQTREFLVRLTSPYGENGIKAIRREVRAEASRLLRHYPYLETDEKRCVDDMTGASDIVTRLRNWRTVHLARLHLLMEEAADEMERLRADWPEQLAAARSEIDRLRNGALDGRETVRQGLSQKNNCPDADNAATQDILTDEEREAIAYYLGTGGPDGVDATLRGLLQRL
jgi:hypothetical protein